MERRAIQVHGIVQGVGFRPYVYKLATRLSLRGFVKNQTGTVFIEVEGLRHNLETFLAELASKPPPLAQIKKIAWQQIDLRSDGDFRIERSEANPASAIFISPDIATCPDCLREMLDPADRRYGYPFLNCTNCGPRLTIIKGTPYDRQQTTMAEFEMCANCRAEYDDPRDRRFHAQPTACAACGPALELRNARGERVEADEPLAAFAAKLRGGAIGALKGLGGYHLTCDATNPSAVADLRRRKNR